MMKKITVFILSFVIAVGSLSMPSQVEAASKPYMKSVNVKWDLKKGKSLTYKTKYKGIGMTKQKVKMSSYKVKNSKKKGYKEATFTLKFTRQWKMSSKQVHKMANTNGDFGGKYYYAIVDYNTGKCLEAKNKQKVTVQKVKDWSYSTPKYCYDKDGCYVWIKNASVTVKVTYPKNYKGLCIGVGGGTSLTNNTKDDTKFWNGKTVFGKTSFYSKKDKSVAHFMRVAK